MDPYTLYQVLYGGAAAAGIGGIGAAGYGTYRAAKGLYNMIPKRKRTSMGTMSTRYRLSKCRKTRSYKRSPVSQRTISAPASRVIDTKYVDQLTTYTGLKRSVAIMNIVGDIQGGSGEGQRVGNDIRLIKYIVTWEAQHGSSNLDQTLRLIMVRSKTGNSATAPALSEIINLDGRSTYSPTSLRHVNSLEDYEILLDKVMMLPCEVATNHALKTASYNVDVCFPQRFSGTGSGTVIRNPVFYILLTNGDNTTTGGLGTLSFRIMYSDI